MIRFDYRSRKTFSGLLFSTLLVLLFSSCSHLLHLDRAQDAFNKGATLENTNFFNPASISSNSPETYYSIAFAEANRAMKPPLKSKLENAKVLGTTYSIKALAAWKLKRYEAAREAADDAMDAIEKESGSPLVNINTMRDYVLMKALNSLIEIQESNDALVVALNKAKTVSDDEAIALYKKWVANEEKTGTIEKAIKNLSALSSTLEEDHELRTYFLMSQLAAYKVQVFALNNVKYHFGNATNNPDNSEKTWWDNEFKRFKAEKNKALLALKKRIPETQKDVLNSWYILLGPPTPAGDTSGGATDVDID